MKPIIVFSVLCALLIGCSKKQIIKTDIPYEEWTEETTKAPAKKEVKVEKKIIVAQEFEEDIIMANVLFDFDSFKIRANQQAKLDAVVEIADRFPGRMIILVGGACEIGEADYNMALGHHRANATAIYLGPLVRNDIDTRSVGEEHPLFDDPDRYYLNRRVEITLR